MEKINQQQAIQALQDKLAVVNAQDALNEARYTQVKNSCAKQKVELSTQIDQIETSSKPAPSSTPTP